LAQNKAKSVSVAVPANVDWYFRIPFEYAALPQAKGKETVRHGQKDLQKERHNFW
jgi:hypothetical protein